MLAMIDSAQTVDVGRRRQQNRLAQRRRRNVTPTLGNACGLSHMTGNTVKSQLQELEAAKMEVRALKDKVIRATRALTSPEETVDVLAGASPSQGYYAGNPETLPDARSYFPSLEDDYVADMEAAEAFLGEMDVQHGEQVQLLSPTSPAMDNNNRTTQSFLGTLKPGVDVAPMQLGSGVESLHVRETRESAKGSGKFGDGRHEALRIAITKGNVSMVSLLIKHGADINAPAGELGRNSLHDAAAGNDVKMVELLLDNGADVGAVDYSAMTALQIAASLGNVDAAGILLQQSDV